MERGVVANPLRLHLILPKKVSGNGRKSVLTCVIFFGLDNRLIATFEGEEEVATQDLEKLSNCLFIPKDIYQQWDPDKITTLSELVALTLIRGVTRHGKKGHATRIK